MAAERRVATSSEIDWPALRPAEKTSAAIRAALDRIAAADAAAAARADDLAARHKHVLLAGGAVADIRALESDIAEARMERERLAALREGVAEQLNTAVIAERKANLVATIEAANAKSAAFSSAFRARYVAAAMVIADLMRMEREAHAAWLGAGQSRHEESRLQPLDGVPALLHPHEGLDLVDWPRGMFGTHVVLPSERLEMGTRAIWHLIPLVH